jgi:hypothetical protein
MKLTATKIRKLLKRKLATAVLISASLAAFATLGDGGKKDQNKVSFNRSSLTSKNFSIRSGYNYKGNNLFSTPGSSRFIMLNTAVSYQKGHSTYTIPLKKKVLLDKIRFSPSPSRY